ncbi:hypothetical protein [Verminephrobacter aporrectodeae]|uniref:hypothetical protein n=1 Tax=Verminephrobacter aporrectodeae TaxID=1110389 RepID=UPI002244BD56|nr:hypothetical protein [Verminephrobacter aporrectodeae]MCW8177211.1 hypothetical protein [Verminephrobacter aporrectodeae subsp. tuberculatae]MCW8200310.1 hypothetical protein [Verminephrobacter aporrectodeae subsp. tuberculatae]MCW8203583.1 hypothetical protein [Verminephrobacter aporrectodeae subsp. tuberculatae]MCW8208731.1 hypothetical protein [Verminephrobacter aporrectodeae subsp. tuberculatae]
MGVKPSYSRPRVSDDGVHVKSPFHTAKYRPEFPVKEFFVDLYEQRHTGEDKAILTARHALYMSAHVLNPARWSGAMRNGSHIQTQIVSPSPERDSVIKTHSSAQDIQPVAV